jgi:7-carboxy-7-deazaguanine synthase
MNFTEILDEVSKYNCNLVEVTGGEPLLQRNVIPFMKLLCDKGYKVLLETSGHVDISEVDNRVIKIMDIKCPGSGESEKVLWDNVNHLSSGDQIKFVISDRNDYQWAKDVVKKYELDSNYTVLFSPVFGEMDNRNLAEWILQDKLSVRYQIQMHKYIWEPDQRGV